MSRYDVPLGAEGEYEKGSKGRVLKNLLGIKLESEMHFAENQALIKAENKLLHSDNITPETIFTTQIICDMHAMWLGKIYEWAGKYRTVDMSKSGFPFPPAHLVAQNMETFESETLTIHTPCNSKQIEEVCLSIAIVHAELLFIHPFREGNGRLARILADLMAAQANAPLPDYGFIGKGSRKRNEDYLRAVFNGYEKNYSPLAEFFLQSIER